MDAELIKLSEIFKQAGTLESRRQVREAVEKLRAAEEIARREAVGTMMMLPAVLQQLGPLLDDLGDYGGVRAVSEEALQLAEKTFGADSRDAVILRATLAAVDIQEGKYEPARGTLVAALQAQRNDFPVDRIGLARTLNNLATACLWLGQQDQTERYIREAHEQLVPRVDDDDPLLARVLQTMALAHATAERFGPALHFFERARVSAGKAFGDESLEYASVCHATARLLGRMLRFPEAIDLTVLAGRIRTKSVGTTNHPIVIEALQTLVWLAGASGRDKDALNQSIVAHRSAVATYGQTDPATLSCWLDSLTAARVAGNKDEAEATLRTITPIVRKVGAGPYLVRCLTDLACLIEPHGQTAETRSIALEGAEVIASVDRDRDRELRRYYEDLAGVLLRIGEATAGIRLLERAIRSDDWAIPQAIATRDDVQRRFYLRQIADGTSQFIRAALGYELTGDPAVAAAAYALVANRKGLMAEAYLAHDPARLAAQQPELTEQLRQIEDLSRELAEVEMAGSTRGTDRLLISTDILKTRLRTLNLEIEATLKPAAAPVAWRSIDADVLANALPDNTALIDVYAVQPERQHDAAQATLEATGSDQWLRPVYPERYVAFVLRRGSPVQMIDLGAGAAIDRLAYSSLVVMNQGRADIVPLDRQGDLRQEPEADLSREIRQRLFDPLRDAIAGARAIVIAPDGVLCQVPFAALVKEGEGEVRLIDDLDIEYVTNARALLQFGRPKASPKAPLVVADPDFDLVKGVTPEKPDSAETAPYYFYFPALPGTADEGWAVAGVLGTTLVRGRKAHEATLRACHSPAVLHVASHGFYMRPFGQGIMVLGDLRRSVSGKYGTFLRGHALAYAENPFLRSGIALAGVNAWSSNVPVPEEMGDGLLNAAEVARLDLRDTELVVLSACSTALGDVHAGEGVAGLLQGLRLAGARTIVAALWQIPDEATAQLMEAFYRALIEQPRQPVPEALKTAQSALRKAGKPAWQWAAHVCYGDPAPLTYVPATGTTQ